MIYAFLTGLWIGGSLAVLTGLIMGYRMGLRDRSGVWED